MPPRPAPAADPPSFPLMRQLLVSVSSFRRLRGGYMLAGCLAFASALSAADVFPAAGASGINPDTPLRLTFGQEPVLGTQGRIEIVDTASGAVVETIDVSQPVAVQTIGGVPNFNYRPLIVSGREATLYPRQGVLAYNRTYAVRVESGVFPQETAVLPAGGWQFTTKAAPPAADSARLIIAADGSGDFCTVQGAIDFIPTGNRLPRTLVLRPGTYTGIVSIVEKHALTLIGEDRARSVIAYENNDRFNRNGGRHPYEGPRPDPSNATLANNETIYRRGVFIAHRTEDLVLTNLTVRNTTPQGGSQAEAVIINGTATARTILRNVDLYSYQDTLQVNGQAYVIGCRVEGDVDFLWGKGPTVFADCVFWSLRSDAYYTQVRNAPGAHGFIFLNCRFDGAPGVQGNALSRIQAWRFPESEVVLVDCQIGPAVSPAGWEFQSGTEGIGDVSRIRFWEINSRDLAGRPIDASQRLPGTRRLDPVADAELIARYRDPVALLGHGWNPR